MPVPARAGAELWWMAWRGGRDWSVFARNAWLMVGLVCWVWRWGRGGTVIWDSLCIVVMHKLCGVGGGG